MTPECETEFSSLATSAQEAFSGVQDERTLEEERIRFLGDKSKLKDYQKLIATCEPERKAAFGKSVNALRQTVTDAFNIAKKRIEDKKLEERLQKEKIDVTLPGIRPVELGSLHPLTIVTGEIVNIFEKMGFEVFKSQEIETEYHNFTALNTPESHPARDEQDTFYTNIASHVILRSQMSPSQVRAMESKKLPLRIISHGRVFRNEETNARKLPFFHQLEVLCIDEEISFSHLKWTLQTFFNEFFGSEIPFRLRPDFFPFTEPSAEVDAQCVFCKGKGCSTCGGKGWLELLGCGLVDPNVLELSGIDSKKYSGFAAGLGLERFTMLKYGISDIRDLYTGDLRFLKQFSYL